MHAYNKTKPIQFTNNEQILYKKPKATVFLGERKTYKARILEQSGKILQKNAVPYN